VTSDGLTTSAEFLTEAATQYFQDTFEPTSIAVNEAIDGALGWVPSLHFKPNSYLTVAAEVSETPYPVILRLRHADIMQIQHPISVYCVCPEEAFLKASNQQDVRKLETHGHGLLTVDATGQVTKRFNCVPLIQHISLQEVTQAISGLPKKIRLSVKEAHNIYRGNPGSGVKELSEILEALINNVGKKAERHNWITHKQATGSLAALLDALDNCSHCYNAKAAIGAAKGYVSEVRNAAHHAPRSRRQAYIKYQDCAHSFREGMRRIQSFRSAMAKVGLSASI
jgi:hypothetical protein